MAIDRITVNLYICCKCQYKWLGGWDTKNDKEHPVPFYCPKCKNLRWNHKYTNEEDALFDQAKEQHTIKKTVREGKPTLRDIDPIAYLFLHRMNPQPDMFELKQLLAMPPPFPKSVKYLEARHEFMLSVINDRIRNADRYQVERLAKYGNKYLYYGGDDKRYHPRPKPKTKEDLAAETSRPFEASFISKKMAKGCKHSMKKVIGLEKAIDTRRERNRQRLRKEWEREAERKGLDEWYREDKEQEEYEKWEEGFEDRVLQHKAEDLEELEMQRNKTG